MMASHDNPASKPNFAPITRAYSHGMYVRERGPAVDTSLESGDAAGYAVRDETILFIHGLGESGLCFERLLGHPGLADRRLLIPDLPGYGRSPWPEQPLSLVAQADHLALWLQNSDFGRVVIAGHSMGGITGLLFCEKYGELAAAMIDIDGNKCEDDCRFSGQATAVSLAEFTASGFAKLQEAIFQTGREDPAHRGYYVSLRLCDPRLYHANSRELVEMSRREDLAERLAALPVPTLYIAGVPFGASARSLQLLDEAGAHRVTIEPSGHWPFIDKTDRFVTELDRFLRQ